MGERKVLNKYYPPDFDPTLIPRRKLDRAKQIKVRLMAPMNMTCTSCGEYIYKAKKFNARKETVQGETYLGIAIHRFYIHCTRCSGEIVFRTDPKNSDYACERGARRNYEPTKDQRKIQAEEDAERAKDEFENPIKALENRTKDSKREMDILDALEELKDNNARQSALSIDDLVSGHTLVTEELVAERLQREEEEDEALVQSVFGNKSNGSESKGKKKSKASTQRIIRLNDDDEDDDYLKKRDNTSDVNDSVSGILIEEVNQSDPRVDDNVPPVSKKRSAAALLGGLVVVKKKPRGSDNDDTTTKTSSTRSSLPTMKTDSSINSGLICDGYGSSDSD